MPFVRKTDSQGSQPPTDTRKLFIGRTGELLFFVQNILKPEEPTHNIISIWGQGGVGKSTLLSRFIDEVHSSDFEEYCLTAIVDELQATPASMMEKFATQLHMQGAFEKALRHYKEALRKLQTERETMQDAVLSRVPDFAGAAAEMAPFVGPLLREGAKATTRLYLDKRQKVQGYKDAVLLEDPVNALTRAFVDELNQLAETQVLVGSRRFKKRRLILFFDTFEQLAAEATPWLLDYFLQADVKSNVVLVIAGRDSIEHSIPDETKRWLPYCDNETIYWIPLNSFTEDETRAYLIKRNITDPERIATIWQLSQGLPLYLSLLTSNPRGKVDPTKDVVDNFLRWIPRHEHIKRQLALNAALFSRPFNQDDLKAFTYLSDHDRSTFYHWLIGQPFVRPQDGRYSYHDLAKELFSRHFYQNSREDYYATRKVLAHHYQRLLEKIQEEEGKEVYRSTEWFHLSLALVSQLFLLPEEASHMKAIEQILSVDVHTYYVRTREIVGMLRELSVTSISGISPRGQQAARSLYQLIDLSLPSQERLEAANFLLNTVAHEPSFPPALLGHLYHYRGFAYERLKEYQRAVDDFQRNLALLDPSAHGNRGLAYWALEEYQQAISEFTRALELDPHNTRLIGARGWNYFYLKEYQQAIDDFEHALELDPNDISAHNGLGNIHKIFKEYQQALVHFERIIEVTPTPTDSHADTHGYYMRGWMYMYLKEFQRAIDDIEYTLELDPNSAFLYHLRGNVYLRLKDMKLALVDFTRSWELEQYTGGGWMAEWVKMCQLGASSTTPERLEALIASATRPTRYYPRVCQGVAHLLRGRYDEALAELEQAIPLPHDEPWDAYFWIGMACASLKRDEEAKGAIEKALEEGLPPVLLAPLLWFEQDRPDFYQKYVMPLMTRYDLL